MEQLGVVNFVLVRDLQKLCEDLPSKEVGVLAVLDKVEFGHVSQFPGAHILVSMDSLLELIESLNLTNHPFDDLYFVYLAKSICPVSIYYHVFTGQQIKELEEKEKMQGFNFKTYLH